MSEFESDFTVEIQKKILAMLLFEPKSLLASMDIVRPETFDHPALADMASILFRFYAKYKRPIGIEEFEEEFIELLSGGKRIPVDEYKLVYDDVLRFGAEGQYEYVRDKLVDFAKVQAVRRAVANANDIVRKKKNFDEILIGVRDALAIGDKGKDVGTFYFGGLEARLAERKSGITRESTAIGTSIPALDKKLGGGLGRGELGIIMGPMKRGKTVFSVNMAYGAMKNGIKVVHYLMEGSESRLQVLYDSRISGVPKDQVAKPERAEEVRKAVSTFYDRPGVETLLIKHFPAQGCTPMTIENHLNQMVAYKFEPELIIVDYLGLMSSTQKNIASSGDRYLMYGQITKELLSLAQRGGYAIWLLHQSTRGSKKKSTIDLDDSADSIEPMRDADLILTLNQVEGEENRDSSEISKLRIFIAGGREVADRCYVDLAMDKRNCRITELVG
jgi:hypothetical protein